MLDPDLTGVTRRRALASLIDTGILAAATGAVFWLSAESFDIIARRQRPSGEVLILSDDDQARLDTIVDFPLGRARVTDDTFHVWGPDAYVWAASAFTILAIVLLVILPTFTQRSPGKFFMGLLVASEQGTPVGAASHMIRLIVGAIDAIPYVIPGVLGIGIASTDIHHRRLGDRAARTVVIDDRRPVRFLSREQYAAENEVRASATSAGMVILDDRLGPGDSDDPPRTDRPAADASVEHEAFEESFGTPAFDADADEDAQREVRTPVDPKPDPAPEPTPGPEPVTPSASDDAAPVELPPIELPPIDISGFGPPTQPERLPPPPSHRQRTADSDPEPAGAAAPPPTRQRVHPAVASVQERRPTPAPSDDTSPAFRHDGFQTDTAIEPPAPLPARRAVPPPDRRRRSDDVDPTTPESSTSKAATSDVDTPGSQTGGTEPSENDEREPDAPFTQPLAMPSPVWRPESSTVTVPTGTAHFLDRSSVDRIAPEQADPTPQTREADPTDPTDRDPREFEPGVPLWSERHGSWLFWDGPSERWLRHDPATGTWGALD